MIVSEMRTTSSMATATGVFGAPEWSGYLSAYNSLNALLYTTAGTTPPILQDMNAVSIGTGIGVNVTNAKNLYESSLAAINDAILKAINSATSLLQIIDCGSTMDNQSTDIDCGVVGDTDWSAILECTVDCGDVGDTITETIDCGTTGEAEEVSNWPSDYNYDCGEIAFSSGFTLPDEIIDCGVFDL